MQEGFQNADRNEPPPLKGFKVATRLSETGSTKAYAGIVKSDLVVTRLGLNPGHGRGEQ